MGLTLLHGRTYCTYVMDSGAFINLGKLLIIDSRRKMEDPQSEETIRLFLLSAFDAQSYQLTFLKLLEFYPANEVE